MKAVKEGKSPIHAILDDGQETDMLTYTGIGYNIKWYFRGDHDQIYFYDENGKEIGKYTRFPN